MVDEVVPFIIGFSWGAVVVVVFATGLVPALGAVLFVVMDCFCAGVCILVPVVVCAFTKVNAHTKKVADKIVLIVFILCLVFNLVNDCKHYAVNNINSITEILFLFFDLYKIFY